MRQVSAPPPSLLEDLKSLLAQISDYSKTKQTIEDLLAATKTYETQRLLAEKERERLEAQSNAFLEQKAKLESEQREIEELKLKAREDLASALKLSKQTVSQISALEESAKTFEVEKDKHAVLLAARTSELKANEALLIEREQSLSVREEKLKNQIALIKSFNGV